nr:MAG TPA: hypothetical protein [Bacteriophage sp.]DAQ73920.1 MAG TPA: hypothetical protein [Herelleviridae sp.]DAJ83365.1 MAG TPA: hypothetical protein [Bacteriophage sp.]DAS25498.1 MAG TPA: hypothetical protein [Bacteriophage sp.]DAU23579.1 MAG TPA: hypothetical protein [Herelleviridae sp.]
MVHYTQATQTILNVGWTFIIVVRVLNTLGQDCLVS